MKFSELVLSMAMLSETSISVFDSISSLNRIWLLSPEYLLREHYYKEFGHYPEWHKSITRCECCGQEVYED